MRIDKRVEESHTSTDSASSWVAILGNPNCGKTALFNRLTGLHHKVGNYPGITVEKKSGWLKNHPIAMRDFPGTYSLNPRSLDEQIVHDMVQSWREPRNRPIAVIVVIDATNITRSIYLSLQILDWNIPTILALNMIDEARKIGVTIDIDQMKQTLQVWSVIPTSAKYNEGIDQIIKAILSIPTNGISITAQPCMDLDEKIQPHLDEIYRFFNTRQPALQHQHLVDTMRVIADEKYIKYLKNDLLPDEIKNLRSLIHNARNDLQREGISYRNLEQSARYAFIDRRIIPLIKESRDDSSSFSERIDSILTHRIMGPVIMLFILVFIFNAIFSWAKYPMELISSGINDLGAVIQNQMADSSLRSLLLDGALAGVGSIVVFFPQILLLVFFLSILEDSGYMARMAFMLDRLLGKIGLQGRSVLPLLSGFACAIPAVTAARIIDNWRDRLITILIIPLMSCSARLPVYTLLISAFIPDQQIFGLFSTQSAALLAVYILGLVVAMGITIILKFTYKREYTSNIVMELPPYRLPMISSLWWQMFDRGKAFLQTAGSIILAVSILLWYLASHPLPEHPEQLSSRERIEQSYAGKIGKAMEPVIQPLGFDWKIGVGLVTSFAAREVIISTLSTIYNMEDATGQTTDLVGAMQNDRDANGNNTYRMLTAISLMVFFAFAAQCMATFAIVKKETNSWKWPVIMVVYLTTLAYVSSLAVYQGGVLLGY
jgi:ferrous iron transport protein B